MAAPSQPFVAGSGGTDPTVEEFESSEQSSLLEDNVTRQYGTAQQSHSERE